MADAPNGFAARWSQRKVQARSGVAVEPNLPPVPAPVDAGPALVPAAAPPEEPPKALTMADVAGLSRDSDFSRFVAAGVDPGVRCAAMKKLFADPHFNVMDGLDTYIADYGQPDPIPLAMLRRMNQSRLLGLFDDQETADDAAVGERAQATASPAALPAVLPAEMTSAPDAAPTEEAPHDDLDLRLQQDNDAGRAGPGEGPRA